MTMLHGPIVGPAYPECLYTKLPKYLVDWTMVDDAGNRYSERRTFATEKDAKDFAENMAK